MEKQCWTCGVTKDVRMFCRDLHKITGYSGSCKACIEVIRKSSERPKWKNSKLAEKSTRYLGNSMSKY